MWQATSYSLSNIYIYIYIYIGIYIYILIICLSSTSIVIIIFVVVVIVIILVFFCFFFSTPSSSSSFLFFASSSFQGLFSCTLLACQLAQANSAPWLRSPDPFVQIRPCADTPGMGGIGFHRSVEVYGRGIDGGLHSSTAVLVSSTALSSLAKNRSGLGEVWSRRGRVGWSWGWAVRVVRSAWMGCKDMSINWSGWTCTGYFSRTPS